MFKKIISLLLAVMLMVSLSACGGGNKNASQQQEAGTIAYIETEIGIHSGLKWPGDSRVNSKNQLVVFDRGYGADSGFVTLNQDGIPVGGSKVDFAGNVKAFTLDEADNIYVVTAESNNSQKLSVVNPQGEVLKTVDLGTFSGTANTGLVDMGVADIAVDSKGNIYITSPSKNIQVLDKEGQQIATLGSQGYVSIDIDAEDNLIAVNSTMGKRVVEKLDTSTGKSIWATDITAQGSGTVNMMGANSVRYSKADKSIYHMTTQNITKYDSTGKLIGTIIDFKSYGILASGYNISEMAIDAEGNIYVSTTSVPAGAVNSKPASEGSGAKTPDSNSPSEPVIKGAPGADAASPSEFIKYELYKYSMQSGDTTAQKQEVITVSVPASNRAIEVAASKFQKDNPGYRIEIQEYPSQDYETYVKNLNTQILSGKGPDIISVAGLPYENYISKNILADLSEMMAKDNRFDINNYYTNILDALKYNDKLYVMPTNFTFNILMANQEILDQESITIDDGKWSWNDFKSVAEKVSKGNRAAMPSVSPMDLLSLFTNDSYSNYIDAGLKKADFISQGFTDLLNTVKAFGEGNLTDSNVKNDMASVLEAAGREAIVFYPLSITDYNMYGFMKSAFKEQLALYNMPSSGGNGGTFTSNSMYAINRNSKYKDQSWEFLKILLSDEIQSQSMQGGAVQGQSMKALGGFSINKTAQQMKAQQAIDASQSGAMRIMMKSGNSSITLSSAPMSQADIDGINKFIAGLNTYANEDANISSIVQDETRNFFSGSKSVEETTKLIQDRVNTYLKE
ncbi:extracellular solute-binding protein [Geosporobacter ferrireducens]|uniref:ABC transporter substrate-binding protein n=1 Tax=Geosporobacter ferrireducens TaxID=1424294 RepID=A0A1D8GM64_9FIRM|nr:extracellular solute-binding protein [Geosporobacter ferrireducens]AOT72001.1 ABC transporter substrate-binding protein [Geosporobacter ferrireducens]